MLNIKFRQSTRWDPISTGLLRMQAGDPRRRDAGQSRRHALARRPAMFPLSHLPAPTDGNRNIAAIRRPINSY